MAVLSGSIGKDPIGAPEEITVKLIGNQPVPSAFTEVALIAVPEIANIVPLLQFEVAKVV